MAKKKPIPHRRVTPDDQAVALYEQYRSEDGSDTMVFTIEMGNPRDNPAVKPLPSIEALEAVMMHIRFFIGARLIAAHQRTNLPVREPKVSVSVNAGHRQSAVKVVVEPQPEPELPE